MELVRGGKGKWMGQRGGEEEGEWGESKGRERTEGKII